MVLFGTCTSGTEDGSERAGSCGEAVDRARNIWRWVGWWGVIWDVVN